MMNRRKVVVSTSRHIRGAKILVATALLLAGVAASAAVPDLDSYLASMSLTLSAGDPTEFVLRYNGPIVEFRGQVCYSFAGYNETCAQPRLEWLTPATEIRLYAPGGVPYDLLAGYVMLARFPALSDRQFAYAPTAAPERTPAPRRAPELPSAIPNQETP
jgi:hypothetical protein